MTKKKETEPTISMPKPTNRCDLRFTKSDGVTKAFGDVEVGDEVTFTVKGKITSLGMSNHNGEYSHESSDICVDVSSVSGKSKAKAENDKELDDMTSEKE